MLGGDKSRAGDESTDSRAQIQAKNPASVRETSKCHSQCQEQALRRPDKIKRDGRQEGGREVKEACLGASLRGTCELRVMENFHYQLAWTGKWPGYVSVTLDSECVYNGVSKDQPQEKKTLLNRVASCHGLWPWVE